MSDNNYNMVNRGNCLSARSLSYDFEDNHVTDLFNYDFDDEFSEFKRRCKNRECLRGVVKSLRVMRKEACNGFKNFTYDYQKRLVCDRIITIQRFLQVGEFTFSEFLNLKDSARVKIEKIYSPFMKKKK